jgi:hypothetical protein
MCAEDERMLIKSYLSGSYEAAFTEAGGTLYVPEIFHITGLFYQRRRQRGLHNFPGIVQQNLTALSFVYLVRLFKQCCGGASLTCVCRLHSIFSRESFEPHGQRIFL